MRFGGYFISEHPAKPTDPLRPSIWSSPVIEVLLRHPEAKLSHVQQYRWGATAVKPTGLLHFRLPRFCHALYSTSDPHAKKPREAAIGRDETGNFRTSKHKEYPNQFCCGLATAIVQAIAQAERVKAFRVAPLLSPHLYSWLHEAEQASTALSLSTWLPDYQGA